MESTGEHMENIYNRLDIESAARLLPFLKIWQIGIIGSETLKLILYPMRDSVCTRLFEFKLTDGVAVKLLALTVNIRNEIQCRMPPEDMMQIVRTIK